MPDSYKTLPIEELPGGEPAVRTGRWKQLEKFLLSADPGIAVEVEIKQGETSGGVASSGRSALRGSDIKFTARAGKLFAFRNGKH